MAVELLPPELLCEILENALDPCPTGQQVTNENRRAVHNFVSERDRFLQSICLVSRHWKDLAYDTRALWAIVSLDCRFKKPRLVRGRAYLQRAGHILLDLYIVGMSPKSKTPEDVWNFWKTLKDRGSQWRTLFLMGGPEISEGQEEYLPPVANLIACEIFKDAPGGIQKLSAAPNLRTYICRHTSFFPFFLTHRLESLHISGQISEILPNLTLFPRLEFLNWIVDRYSPSLVITPPLDIPSLTSITLRNVPESPLATILTSITAVNLCLLSVEVVADLAFFGVPVSLSDASLQLHFPDLSILKYRGDRLSHLRSLVASVSGDRKLKLEVSKAIPRRITGSDFANQDAIVRWLEANADVEWSTSQGDPQIYFPTWNAARAYFQGSGDFDSNAIVIEIAQPNHQIP